MTREEVKAQLSKHPMVWDCTGLFYKDGVKVIDHYSEIVEISCEADLSYTMREELDDRGDTARATLYLTTIDVVQHMYSPYEIVLCVYRDRSLDDIKRIAEEHRLKLACSLLGIKE